MNKIINNFLMGLTFSQDFSKILDEYKRNQHMTKEELDKLKKNKLNNIMNIAKDNIPYYKDTLNQRKELNINDFPILDKNVLSNHAMKFIYKTPLPWQMSRKSSGSSGKITKIYLNRYIYGHYLVSFWRGLSWYDVNPGDRGISLFGKVNSAIMSIIKSFKDKFTNNMRLFYYKLTDNEINDIIHFITDYKPKFLFGYPSLLYRIAKAIKISNKNVLPNNLKVIVTTGENLYEFQRVLIQSVFGCKVSEEYGCTELGTVGFECPEGNIHFSVDNVFIETINNDKYPEQSGEIVATQLNNTLMPIIRYKNGDIGKISETSCKCGITLPIIHVLGRKIEEIITEKGISFPKIVFNNIYNNIQQGTSHIPDFRILQNSLKNYTVVIYKDKLISDIEIKNLQESIVNIMGKNTKIDFKLTDELDLDISGKLNLYSHS
ncbi:MAG: phenylacetate--CoA ligase family protein [Endomicrobiales bacterium]|nr:phenylacetate--CoA ligase family protein [Endomicrobiales bacterium]